MTKTTSPDVGALHPALHPCSLESRIMAAANAAWDARRFVYVRTMTMVTVIPWFRRDALRQGTKTGNLLLRRGRSWDRLVGTTLQQLAVDLGVARFES